LSTPPQPKTKTGKQNRTRERERERERERKSSAREKREEESITLFLFFFFFSFSTPAEFPRNITRAGEKEKGEREKERTGADKSNYPTDIIIIIIYFLRKLLVPTYCQPIHGKLSFFYLHTKSMNQMKPKDKTKKKKTTSNF